MSERMPQNTEAEQAVISLLLGSPERFIEVIDALAVNDFYSVPYQFIWRSMTELFKAGHDIDVVSLRTQIRRQEPEESKLTIEALMACYDNMLPSGGNLNHFIKLIKNKSILRQIVIATQLQGYAAQTDDADPTVVLQELEKDILAITDTSIDARPTDVAGIISEVDIDIARAKEVGWQGYNTGFTKLDTQTGGLIPTQSWIIGAYTGTGKTFFILQILLNVLRQGGKVMLFSTEMDRKLNMLRLIGNIAGLGTIGMIKGNLLEPELAEMKKAEAELASFKGRFTIYDNVYTMSEIRLKAKKTKLTQGLDIVAVDFIQNLQGGESIYERMSEAAMGLQQLAQELQVTMLIGSQVSQAAASGRGEAIEFKGAGEIAAIADVALWLAKDKNDASQTIRKVNVRKLRHGVPAQVLTKLLFPSGRVIDIDRPAPKEEDYQPKQLYID